MCQACLTLSPALNLNLHYRLQQVIGLARISEHKGESSDKREAASNGKVPHRPGRVQEEAKHGGLFCALSISLSW
jgi:hypothetical protein